MEYQADSSIAMPSRDQFTPKRVTVTLPYRVFIALLFRADHEGRSTSSLAAFLLERALAVPKESRQVVVLGLIRVHWCTPLPCHSQPLRLWPVGPGAKEAGPAQQRQIAGIGGHVAAGGSQKA